MLWLLFDDYPWPGAPPMIPWTEILQSPHPHAGNYRREYADLNGVSRTDIPLPWKLIIPKADTIPWPLPAPTPPPPPAPLTIPWPSKLIRSEYCIMLMEDVMFIYTKGIPENDWC